MIVAQILPTPGDVIRDAVTVSAGWGFDKAADAAAGWVLDAVGFFANGVLNFFKTAARPDVTALWFAGPGSPYSLVRNIAGLFLAGFVCLAVIQALLAGDSSAMIRRVVVDLPSAVLGMAATTVITAKLLELTDSLSTAVLTGADGHAAQFLASFTPPANAATGGAAVVIVGLVAVVAGLLLWIELLVRSALIYLLVALSPLAFAAGVWPATRGVLRRTLEVLLAIILSKLVIAVAIAVGAAALAEPAGPPAAPTGVGDSAATTTGSLIVGASVLCLAAFAPFLVLRLIPLAEAALIAQGVSRSPARAVQGGVGTALQVQSLSRLAAGGTQPTGKPNNRGNSGSGGSGWQSGAPPSGSTGTAAQRGPARLAQQAVAAVEQAPKPPDQRKERGR